jgi:hypothetical protein
MASSESSRHLNSGGYCGKAETGTPVAIYNNSKSDAAFSGYTDNTVRVRVGIGTATNAGSADNTGNKQGWGGARNRGDRVSDSLSLHQAEGIVRAAHRACAIGLPFNRHVTIHWERAGVADAKAAGAIGAYLTLARDWLRKRGWGFAYSWVRENGDDKGSHVHILMHIDPAIAQPFTAMQRRWLRRVTGKPYRKGVIRTSRIGGSVRAFETAPEAYQANLAVVVGYVLKGASQGAAMALGLDRLESGGSIIGKQAGWSVNVGSVC